MNSIRHVQIAALIREYMSGNPDYHSIDVESHNEESCGFWRTVCESIIIVTMFIGSGFIVIYASTRFGVVVSPEYSTITGVDKFVLGCAYFILIIAGWANIFGDGCATRLLCGRCLRSIQNE